MDTQTENTIERVTVRFSGDSGDGMQLTGTLFSQASALFGNDLATFPDFPSEIRAPQGSLAGVSGFQVHIGSTKIHTPGDYADVLVAMNPAALRSNIKWVKKGGNIIIDADTFDPKNLEKAGYTTDPIEDGSLADYNLVPAPIGQQTRLTLEGRGLDNKIVTRSKNMFALGILCWMYSRQLDHPEHYLDTKFSKNEDIALANKAVLHAGYNFAGNVHALTRSHIAPANIDKGRYRNISGNIATAWGLLAAAEKSGLSLFLGSYPITPATDILHELAKRKEFHVTTFQAEDEIAGICTAIGASFAGQMGVTTTSGPGLALKSEAIGLAVMAELPLVIIDVQRGGPSTGMPTKTEQADLMQALYGRNGESPVAVIAPSTPSNCFEIAYNACKIAIEHMTPVIMLSDGFLANGSQPWKIPAMADMPAINPHIVTHSDEKNPAYLRDENLVRNWIIPGTPELMHRLGSLEKDFRTGGASQDAANHQLMVDTRADKIERIAQYIPHLECEYAPEGELLIVGWGGTYGHLRSAAQELHTRGMSVGLAHFNYIKPLPRNTAEVFSRFKQILVCELNRGQFAGYLRMEIPEFRYLQLNKMQGLPFTEKEVIDKSLQILEGASCTKNIL